MSAGRQHHLVADVLKAQWNTCLRVLDEVYRERDLLELGELYRERVLRLDGAPSQRPVMPTHPTVRAVEWRSWWSKGTKVKHVTVVVRLREGSLPEPGISREIRASDQVVTTTELIPRPDELLGWTTMPTTLPCPC